MGFFGRASIEGAVPPRRPNARCVPLTHPAPETSPASPSVLTVEQEVQYNKLVTFLRSGEHGMTFSDDEEFYLTREQILRFCRATKWEITKAQARILVTLKWRREYGVDQITAEHVEPEARTGKQVILGFDNSQRPCLYLFPGRQNTDVSPRQVQYLVWCLERVIDIMPAGVENLALLVNYKGSSGDKNPGIGQGREVLNILQTHYVETLGRALVINIPFFVWGFFKLITPFIDPLTREKLKFNEDMTAHVPKTQLDSEFGGEVVFDYVHEQYWPALLKLCKEARAQKIANWKAAGGGLGISEAVLKTMSNSDTTSESRSSQQPQTDTTSGVDVPLGTRLVKEANTAGLSSEPVSAVYVPETQDGPKLAVEGEGLQ